MFNYFLRILSYILIFIAIYRSSKYISNKDYEKGIEEFMKLGLIPLSLISALRHLVFTGSILPDQHFFEYEAGGANLAVGIAGIYSIYNKLDIEVLGIIFLIYSIYLLISLIAWIKFNKNIKIFNIIAFLSIIVTLSYYTYITLTI
tara:strand:- start:1 stop:438 length:438 start_codon:yes stop_codon:yes gene_type:complete